VRYSFLPVSAHFIVERLLIAGRLRVAEGIFGRLAGMRIDCTFAPSERPAPLAPRLGDAAEDLEQIAAFGVA
jgi:hypothetical protein